MTMHQPGQPSFGGQVIPMLVFTVLGLVGTTVGIIVLLFMLQEPRAPAAAPLSPRRASFAPATPPAPSPPVVFAPSAGVGRPLPMPAPNHQVSAQRAQNGHFYFDVAVNGITIHTVFDTGATQVALRAEDAGRIGIAVNGLTYSVPVNTANGISYVAPVMLDTMQVGDIIVHDVFGTVSKPGTQSVTLLGQSFMSKLAGYRVEDGALIMQGH
ncbi:MAG TPA: TIGR02281 family clan AA aspartic protease [Acetobacteraceae bacterium]